LEGSDHATYCPYKGDCSYYNVPAGGKKSVNAVWSYEEAFPAVEIRGHVAFYPDRVDEIAEQLATEESSTNYENKFNEPNQTRKNKPLVLEACFEPP
jgi:nucleotidyltransferase-like protein